MTTIMGPRDAPESRDATDPESRDASGHETSTDASTDRRGGAESTQAGTASDGASPAETATQTDGEAVRTDGGTAEASIDDPAAFESVDWSTIESTRRGIRKRTLAFLVGIGFLAASVLYDYYEIPGKQPTLQGVGGPEFILFGQRLVPVTWDVTGIEWLFMAAVLAFACFFLVPLATHPRLTRLYWDRLSEDRLAVASLAFLVLGFVAGVIGPVLYPPDVNTAVQSQPPVFLSTEMNFYVSDCYGSVQNNYCHGTSRYPLGTNALGKSLTSLTVSGFRVVIELAFVTSLFIVPLATVVGTLAGYFRGRVDTVLMGYVDAQQTVPAFIAYLVLAFWGRTLFLFVLVFGLFSWGGIARLVRSETLQRREEQYVLAAKNAGASDFYVLREHILPNVSNTVVTAMTRMIPLLILLHTAVAYMGMNNIMNESWGETIANGFNGLQAAFPQVWWTPVIPTVFLALTVMAFGVLGDSLRDALDPREA